MKASATTARHGLILLFLMGSTFFSLYRGMTFAGINGDESAVGCAALNMLHKDLHLPSYAETISFRGRDIPLIAGYYRGPWEIYAAAPFVRLIPDRSKAMKIYVLCWALLCIAAIYGLLYVLSDDPLLAALCALSVATSPYLTSIIPDGLLFSGVGGASISCLALMCLIAALRRRSRAYWYFSCALTGLSVGIAPEAAAFFLAWLLSVFWMRRELKKRVWRSEGPHILGCSIPLLGLGVAPMIFANLLNGWRSATFVADALVLTNDGVRNTHYLQNLQVRLHQLSVILGGGYGTYPGTSELDFWKLFLGTCCGLFVAGLLRAKLKNQAMENTSALPMVFIPIIFLLSPFTLMHLGPHHLFILLPLGLSVAAALPGLCGARLARLLSRTLIACLLAGLWLNAGQLRRFWEDLDKHGDYHLESRAIYPLAEWLEQISAKRVFVSLNDPHIGFHFSPLYFLTNGRIELKDFSEASCREGTAETDGYFILDRLHEVPPESFSLLQRSCRLEKIKEFKRRSGETVFEVYTTGTRHRSRTFVL